MAKGSLLLLLLPLLLTRFSIIVGYVAGSAIVGSL
jgi:hypothetical protein